MPYPNPEPVTINAAGMSALISTPTELPWFSGDCLIVFLIPTATVTTFAVKLPMAAYNGQRVRFLTTQQIVSLALSSANTPSTLGTTTSILGAVTTMIINGYLEYVYCKAINKWMRSG